MGSPPCSEAASNTGSSKALPHIEPQAAPCLRSPCATTSQALSVPCGAWKGICSKSSSAPREPYGDLETQVRHPDFLPTSFSSFSVAGKGEARVKITKERNRDTWEAFFLNTILTISLPLPQLRTAITPPMPLRTLPSQPGVLSYNVLHPFSPGQLPCFSHPQFK